MPVNPELLKKIGDPLDVEAGRQATDLLMMAWGNTNLVIGNGKFPDAPSQTEFNRMGLELVKTGKITVRQKDGTIRVVTVDELKKSMLDLADSLDDEEGAAAKKGLKEAAKKLDDFRSQSAALGKVKVALAEAVEENSGPIFGMSFGNLLGGLFSYIGKFFSWVFSGFKGEMPGFRDTMARHMGTGVRRSAQSKLTQLAASDPDAAALLATRGEDGVLLQDTLVGEMHKAVLKEGGVDVGPPVTRVSTQKIGDIDGYLREQVRGVNEYNGRQIAAAAMGAREDKAIGEALKFNVGSRKVDLNFGPVRTVFSWLRGGMGPDKMEIVQKKVGESIAAIFDEHAEEYARLKTPEEKKTFIAKYVREGLIELRGTDEFKDGRLTDEMVDGLAGEVSNGVVANEKQFRLLPKEKMAEKPRKPARDMAPDKRLDEALGKIADTELKDTIMAVGGKDGGEELYKKARARFIESGKKIIAANSRLLEEKNYTELSRLIVDDIFKDEALVKEFKTKAKTATIKRGGMEVKMTTVLALVGVNLDASDDTKLKKAMAGQLTPMLRKYEGDLKAATVRREEPGEDTGIPARPLKDIFTDLVKQVESDPRVQEKIGIKEGVDPLTKEQRKQLNDAKALFIETAEKTVKDNPALVGNRRALAEKIIDDTKKALKDKGIELNEDGLALLGQMKVEIMSRKYYDQILASAGKKAPSVEGGGPSIFGIPLGGRGTGGKPVDDGPSEDELNIERLNEILTPQLGGYLKSSDPKSAFLIDIFKKRENLAELPADLPKKMADAISPKMAAALLKKDGSLVKKKSDGTYEKSDEEAFLAAKGQIYESLKSLIKDDTLRGALAEEMAVGLLAKYRPKEFDPKDRTKVVYEFKAPDKHRTHVPTLLSQELDPKSNTEMRVLLNGLRMGNKAPLNEGVIRNATVGTIIDSLRDPKMANLPPEEFAKQFRARLEAKLCECDKDGHNKAGFTDPRLITMYSEKVVGAIGGKSAGKPDIDKELHKYISPLVDKGVSGGVAEISNLVSKISLPAGWAAANVLMQDRIKEIITGELVKIMKEEDLSGKSQDDIRNLVRDRLKDRLGSHRGELFHPETVRRAYIYNPFGKDKELGTVDLIPDWVKNKVIDKIANDAANQSTSGNLIGKATPDIQMDQLGGLDSALVKSLPKLPPGVDARGA